MIVVTGASGFLGGHLVDALLERRPGRELRLLDLRPPDAAGSTGARWLEGSVLDREVVSAAVEGADAVVHLAAMVRPDSDEEKLLELVNVEGTRNVYRAAVDADCDVFVHLSSSGVYGPPSRAEP